MTQTKHDVNVVVSGKAQDAGALGYMDKLAAKAKEIRRENRLSGETALEGVLKGGLGRFGLEAMGLGMPMLVADFATKLADRSADQFAAMRRKINEGADGIDIADGFARALPIVGDMYAVTFKLAGELSGINEEIEKTNKEAELTKRFFDASTRAAETQRRVLMESADTARKLRQELALSNADPVSRGSMAIDFDFANQQSEIARKRRDIMLKINESFNDKMSPLRDQMKDANAEANPSFWQDFWRGEFGSQARENRIKAAEMDAKNLRTQGAGIAAQRKKLLDELKKTDADEDKMRNDLRIKRQEEYERQVNEARAEAIREGAERLADLRAEAEIRAYEAAGDRTKAEAVRIERERQKSIAAELLRFGKEVQQDPGRWVGRGFQVFDTVRELNARAEQQKAEASQRARADDERKNMDALNRYNRSRIDMLEEEGRIGDINSKQEAERLKLAQDFNEAMAERLRIINDPKSTGLEKHLAEIDMGQLRRIYAMREAQRQGALMAVMNLPTSSVTAAGSTGRFAFGEGASLAESYASKNRELQQKHIDYTKKIADKLAETLEWQKANLAPVGPYGTP
jgi:hypothetical protein